MPTNTNTPDGRCPSCHAWPCQCVSMSLAYCDDTDFDDLDDPPPALEAPSSEPGPFDPPDDPGDELTAEELEAMRRASPIEEDDDFPYFPDIERNRP